MRLFYIFLLPFSVFTTVLFAQPGTVDVSFANNGRHLASITGEYDRVKALVELPDGNLVIAGDAFAGSFSSDTGANFLYKLLPDGTLDEGFGILTIDITPKKEYVQSMAVSSDGKITLLSTVYSNPLDSVLIARFLPDGSPDFSFGQNGIVFSNFNLDNFYLWKVLSTSDDKLLFCGESLGTTPGEVRYIVLKLNTDGSPDSTFGTNGLVVSDTPWNPEFLEMALLPDGKFLCSGILDAGLGYYEFFAIRFLPNGIVDVSFGVDGWSRLPSPSGFQYIHELITREDGSFYVHGGNRIGRFQATGVLDSTFGENGLIMPYGQHMALMENEKIIEWTNIPNPSLYDSLIWLRQLLPSGQPDPSFGINGELATQAVGNAEPGYMDAAQRLLLGGSYFRANPSGGGVLKAAVFRVITELSLGILEMAPPGQSTFVYPNPIHTEAQFLFELASPQQLSLRLIDMNGRIVQTFFTSRDFSAGEQAESLAFYPHLPSGQYVLQLEGQQRVFSTKIMLNQ